MEKRPVVDEEIVAADDRVQEVDEKEVGDEYEISLENAFQARYKPDGIMHREREEHIRSMKYEESPSGHVPYRMDADRVDESRICKQAHIKDGLVQKILSESINDIKVFL